MRFQDLAQLIRGEVPANIDEKARKKPEDILVATLNIQDKGNFLWDQLIISSIKLKCDNWLSFGLRLLYVCTLADSRFSLAS